MPEPTATDEEVLDNLVHTGAAQWTKERAEGLLMEARLNQEG